MDDGVLLRIGSRGTRTLDQAGRYVAVGATGYLLAMAIFAVGVAGGLSPYLALPPAFVLNGVWNFTLNRLWCFPPSGRRLRSEAVRATVVAAGTLAANYAVMSLLLHGADMPPVPAQALTIILVTPVGFFGNKLWSFNGG